MRLIIICLCLCSGVSLVAFSRVGFPEDPLRILAPRPAPDREAKDQARFARAQPQRPSGAESIGAPVEQDEAPRSVSIDELAQVEASAAEIPVSVPIAVPQPAAAPASANKVDSASECHPTALHARSLVPTARMAMKRRVLFVRAAMTPYRPRMPGAKRAQSPGVTWLAAPESDNRAARKQ